MSGKILVKNAGFSTTKVPIIDPEGTITGLVGIGHDITERKAQAQRELALAREVTALEERQRLARDLHDNVSQLLFSANILAETLPRLLKTHPEEIGESLTQLYHWTKGAQTEMRGLLLELRPNGLQQMNLSMLLTQLADSFTTRTTIPVELHLDKDKHIPTLYNEAFYRIAQEAFTNIIKHAHATEVSLTFSAHDHQFMLSIQDNGRGFDSATIPSERLGQKIMQERAADIGATIDIYSNLGKGTCVTVIKVLEPEPTC